MEQMELPLEYKNIEYSIRDLEARILQTLNRFKEEKSYLVMDRPFYDVCPHCRVYGQ